MIRPWRDADLLAVCVFTRGWALHQAITDAELGELLGPTGGPVRGRRRR